MYKIMLIILTTSMLFMLPQYTFGHGMGSETLPPQKMGDRTVIMEVTSNTDNATKAKQVTFSLTDKNTKNTVHDVLYHVKTVKNNKILFEGDFKTGNGKLQFELIPTNSGQITVKEKQDEGIFGMLSDGRGNVVEARGDTFSQGGLYKFEIHVLSAENYLSESAEQIRFDAGISFLESSSTTEDTESGKQEIKIISYYDIIKDLRYSKESREITFGMPFDWSDSGINQTSVVHEEVFIPKSFAELLATKYTLFVNETPMPDTAVIIDDYSDSDFRIIHIVLGNSLLQNIKATNEGNRDMSFSLQPSKENRFPITRYTANAQYKVNLSWDPPTITSGTDTRLSFTIQEAYLITNKTIPARYDLKILQGNHELYKTGGTTSSRQDVKNTVMIPISADISGPITIRFENIGGNDLADAEFLTSVEKPAIIKPTFPLRLTSSKSNSEGSYSIDLTWFPSSISTNEQTEFVMTVKDKENRPIPQSSFDFVILQKGNEVFRQKASAPAGGTYVDYTFLKEQEGPTTLRIENINHSSETVELTVIVTPEFPVGASIAMAFGIGIVMLIRFKTQRNSSLLQHNRLVE